MSGSSPRKRVRVRKTATNNHLTDEELADIAEADALAEFSDIDKLVARYAQRGTRVDLSEAFPTPAPPPPNHPALVGAVSQPDAVVAYTAQDPAEIEALETENAYAHEHELVLMHRMLMRNATLFQIAESLGKSVIEVRALKHELSKRITSEAANMNPLTYTGKAVAYYGEIKAAALRGADAVSRTVPAVDGVPAHTEGTASEHARYLALALAAENSLHRFLSGMGLYDNAPLRPQVQKPDEVDDTAVMMDALKAMMNPEAYERALEGVLGEEDTYEIKQSDPFDNISVLD